MFVCLLFAASISTGVALAAWEHDGKVSVERAKLEGMADILVVPHAHPFIMKSDLVIDQVLYFLEYGRFEVDESGAD